MTASGVRARVRPLGKEEGRTHEFDGDGLTVQQVCSCGTARERERGAVRCVRVDVVSGKVPTREDAARVRSRWPKGGQGNGPSKMTPNEPSPILRPTRKWTPITFELEPDDCWFELEPPWWCDDDVTTCEVIAGVSRESTVSTVAGREV